jgi:glycosyltransferase involved in cell wall biosynthesis
MAKKKILHVTQSTGGVGTYVSHIVNHANPELFDFAMIAPADARFEQFCRERNIPFYPVDLHRNINPLSNVKALYKIIRVFKKEQPDVIHAHSARGGFLGRAAAHLLHLKVVYTPHAFSYLSFTGLKRTVFYSLETMARKWTTVLLAISYSEANRAVYELGYDKKQVKTILNAIPLNENHITYKECSCLKIGMIGRLTNQKNHFLFLELAERLLQKYPQLKFTILGAGIHDELADDIDNMLITHQLVGKVEILHWGDAATSQQYLNELDIFVMPSIFEGLPFSLLEAMSHGIPCVVSKVDGNNDVINNNENGFSCLGIDEFFHRMELLINDVQLRQRLGIAGFEYVKDNHSIRGSTQKLEDVYLTT